jgi:hypothetical protein
MYPQIVVNEEDRKFRKIKQFDQENKLCNLGMTTLAYSKSSSGYLAAKCLHKIADHIKKDMP